MSQSTPTPGRRRWLRLALLISFGLIVLILVVGTACFPIILSSGPGRRAILARLNREFAPGRLSIDQIQLSWSRPTELVGLTLFDEHGTAVLQSPHGSIDRSLWNMIVAPKAARTLQLDDSTLNIARQSNGAIDLVQALGSVIEHSDPLLDLTVRLGGKVSFRDAALVRPFLADSLDFWIRIRPSPQTIAWSLKLREPTPKKPGGIDVSGEFDPWRDRASSKGSADLSASIKVDAWPVSGTLRGSDLAGAVDGKAEVARTGGRWSTGGDARLTQLVLGSWSLDGPPPGEMTLAWKSDSAAESVRLNGKVRLDKLGRLPGPISAEFKGAYSSNQDRVELDKLAIAAGWAKLDASGRVDDLGGSRLADIQGTFDPDYIALTDYLSRNVEPNAKVTGKVVAWRVNGALAGLSAETLPRDLAISAELVLNEADIYGMKLGPTKFNARWQAGAIAFDPIESTLNGGKLVLRPSIDLDAPGGPVVKLGADSRLVDAEINDEVSGRVLSFVAPVLNQATHVNGRVSASLVSAEFPIAKSPGKRANVVGSIQFRDVVFAPSPLSRELLAIVGQRPTEGAGLVLNDPINLKIADGRIEQKGLSVPIGKLAKLEVEGWVDFNRKIGLVATVPINPELFPNAPVLNGVAQATRIRVPIEGTLDQPKVDREAFKENLSKMGREMLTQTAAQGLMQLFSAMSRPKDPNAPPPPSRLTAPERKAKRLEKRAMRLEKKQLD